MANLEDLFSEISPSVRGCPEFAMADALIRAARTLCYESWFIRRVINFETVANQKQYVLIPPVGEEVFAVKHAQIMSPNTGIIPLRFPYGTFVNPNIGPQMPLRIEYIAGGVVQLDPVPDKAYPVAVEVLTQPALNTDVIPDELVSEFRIYLGYGALAWLFTHKSEDYYDPAQASDMERKFSVGINKAKTKAAFDNTPGPHAWVQRGFAGRGRGIRRF